MPTQLPRVNVTVTEEQHALLLELASLDPETSASGYLRQLLDQVTPLLRVTVPMMRAAKEAHGDARQQLQQPLADFMAAIEQLDLLDASEAPGAPVPSESEGGRTKRRTCRGS
jgi:hypothetical protein